MKQKILCLLLFVLLAVIYIWTNEKITFYLLMTMVMAVVFAIVSNVFSARRLEVEVGTGECTAHDNVLWDEEDAVKNTETQDVFDAGKDKNTGAPNGKIEVSLHNRSIFPVFRCDVVLTVMNLLTDSHSRIERSYMLGPFGMIKDTIYLETLFCGRVETDIDVIECIDCFSLTKKKLKAVSRGYYYIYPEYTYVDTDEALRQRVHSSRMETYLNRKGNDPTEILDIRDYERGDSVKMIHWKLSAKWKKKMVRELDMPSNQDTLLVFGLFGDTRGEDTNRLAEYVLSLSRSLLDEDIHHDAVLLDKEGKLIRVYSIEGEESYGGFEKRFLNGGISVSGEDVNAYVMRHESIWRYSTMIYVSNEKPEELVDIESVIYMELS